MYGMFSNPTFPHTVKKGDKTKLGYIFYTRDEKQRCVMIETTDDHRLADVSNETIFQ